MIDPRSIQTEALQVSAFTKDQELSPTRVMRRALRLWGELYDGEPMALPIADTVPPEVATVTLVSQDGRHRLEAARTRVNLFRIRVGEPPLDLDGSETDLALRLVEIFEGEEAPIGRLAAVATRFADAAQPGLDIAKQFIRPEWIAGPLNRPKTLEIHAHKIFNLTESLQVNSWVRIKTAQRALDLTPIVVVEQDINTLAEERQEREFDRSAAVDFFQRVARELATVLALYFPVPTRSEEESS